MYARAVACDERRDPFFSEILRVIAVSSARYTADGKPVALKQPTTAEERITAAAAFQRDYEIAMPVLVDPPLPGRSTPPASGGGGGGAAVDGGPAGPGRGGADGAFEAAFAPWPLRFYGCRAVADEGGSAVRWELGYLATPDQCEYSLADLRTWLLGALGRAE